MSLCNVRYIRNKEHRNIGYSLIICIPGCDMERKQEAWEIRKEGIVSRLQVTSVHKIQYCVHPP